MNYLPEKLQKYRKHYKYSQDYLAKVLDIDVIDYMGIENGRIMINYEQIIRLSKLYRVNASEIFKNDQKITLKKVDDTTTDQINLNYFMRQKSFSYKAGIFVKKYWYLVIAVVLIVGISIGLIINKKEEPTEEEPLIFNLSNKDLISTSNTSLVYIEKGSVKGKGDNSSLQISDLPSGECVKVQEGRTFTACLFEDGKVEIYGAFEDKNIVQSLENIIDIAAGYNHLVLLDNKGIVYAYGDSTNNKLEIKEWTNIKKIYAFEEATVGITNDGNLLYTGELIGNAKFNQYKNVKDIDASSNISVVLADGKVFYSAKVDKYTEVESWDNIIDVACGDEYIAGLKKNGTVVIAIDNTAIKESVSKWEDIKAISSGRDFLIGFDLTNIYGVGNNNYGLFESEEDNKQILDPVNNIKIDTTYRYLYVSFDEVEHARGYRVILNVGIGISYDVTSHENIRFETSKLEEGKTYVVDVIALGDNINYKNSNTNKYYYTYIKAERIPFTLDLDSFVGKTKDELETYLNSIGITKLTKFEREEEELCLDNEVISSLDYEGGTRYEDEKEDIEIKYSCCKLEEKKDGE